MRVLAGDIGGTKTAVAVVEADARRLSVRHQRTYRSADFESLDRILAEFLDGVRPTPPVACFGVAGPVVGGKAQVTKLPWAIDERALATALGIATVRVINDFVAAAAGLSYLRPRQRRTLAAGKPEPRGPIALIGAGTGLGQAALVWTGTRYAPLPSEGGHADLAARDAGEDRLIGFLRSRFGRVTRDRVLSGGGLAQIYDFLKEERFAREKPSVARAMEREDKAAVISRLALARRDRLCQEALRVFLSIYGSEAGNLALQYRATGGLFVGGGIAARILPAFRGSEFLESFLRKPPMEPLLSRVPVHIVTDPRLGLFGAAASAYWTAIETSRLSSKTSVRRRRR
ncbi:MAG TPA: glucokinase [Thermoanaerobaculia bacterium]|nr:glucokinase [Thermoanaerobaculia bacterium]